ncbi:MAG: hypothetical protein MJ158_01405 [Alphaproteobacteria bacterium]|nr:hypothetical protein [Alphaproteobacteria bacterium]
MENTSVSARAAFGEEIKHNKITKTEKITKNTPKTNTHNIIGDDILSPKRPSDNLWASATEHTLKMPSHDEILVVRDESVLPEENLNVIADNKDLMLDSQIQRLNDLQQLADNSVKARPIMITTPITGKSKVVSKKDVTVRREIVPMTKEVIAKDTKEISEPRIAMKNDMVKLSPTELKKAFKKTYLSENKHLSTYQIDNKFDVVSDMSVSSEGFTAQRDLSEDNTGVRALEIKISFRDEDSALSRENYNLLSEYASIVVSNPKRAIQISIPESVVSSKDTQKLTARRLAIVEQVLRDTGVAEQRIVPVLSQRSNKDNFVLRIISGDQYETLTQQKSNMFGDSVSKKTYKSMSW